jgi:eukaryotic-like serine/threonine-protein kinase
VSVIDFGVLDSGSLYLVMEALDGEHLGQRLAREKVLLWSDAVMIARGVLLGLRHAHERGIVHRDIKPDNIFIANKDCEEVVKILDFGIAKFYASGAPDDQQATRAGIAVGTPTYLSPEQAVGDPITPACDVYSTSVVLYEMLVGRAPFEDHDVLRLMTAHTACAVPAFRELAADVAVPDGLEAIVRDGLAKRAGDRIASALEYVQRLDEVLLANNVEIAAMPLSARGTQPLSIPVGPYTSLTPAPGRLGRASTSPVTVAPPRTRARWLVAALALIIAVALAGAYVQWWLG